MATIFDKILSEKEKSQQNSIRYDKITFLEVFYALELLYQVVGAHKVMNLKDDNCNFGLKIVILRKFIL